MGHVPHSACCPMSIPSGRHRRQFFYKPPLTYYCFDLSFKYFTINYIPRGHPSCFLCPDVPSTKTFTSLARRENASIAGHEKVLEQVGISRPYLGFSVSESYRNLTTIELLEEFS